MNDLSNIYTIINTFVDKLVAQEEIIGVCLLGGISKKRYDNFSDIDIAILLDKKPKKRYLPPFSFSIPFEANSLIEINLSQLILSIEKKATWDFSKIEAYLNAEILYDTDEVFKKLIAKKSQIGNLIESRLLTNLNQYYWKVQQHYFSTEIRGFKLSSNILLVDGIYLLIESIFLINNRLVPHSKWIEKEIDMLPNKPDNLIPILSLFFNNIGSQNNFEGIIKEINLIYKWICNEFNNKYDYQNNNYYDNWAKLISNRQIEKIPFAEQFSNNYKEILSNQERLILKGQVAFYLCSSKKEVKKNINSFKLSESAKAIVLNRIK